MSTEGRKQPLPVLDIRFREEPNPSDTASVAMEVFSVSTAAMLDKLKQPALRIWLLAIVLTERCA